MSMLQLKSTRFTIAKRSHVSNHVTTFWPDRGNSRPRKNFPLIYYAPPPHRAEALIDAFV